MGKPAPNIHEQWRNPAGADGDVAVSASTHSPNHPITHQGTSGVVQPGRASIPYVAPQPRSFVMRYPPTQGDSKFKLGPFVWKSQRSWLRQVAMEQDTTVEALIIEAIDDLRAKVEKELTGLVDSRKSAL